MRLSTLQSGQSGSNPHEQAPLWSCESSSISSPYEHSTIRSLTSSRLGRSGSRPCGRRFSNKLSQPLSHMTGLSSPQSCGISGSVILFNVAFGVGLRPRVHRCRSLVDPSTVQRYSRHFSRLCHQLNACVALIFVVSVWSVSPQSLH